MKSDLYNKVARAVKESEAIQKEKRSIVFKILVSAFLFLFISMPVYLVTCNEIYPIVAAYISSSLLVCASIVYFSYDKERTWSEFVRLSNEQSKELEDAGLLKGYIEKTVD